MNGEVALSSFQASCQVTFTLDAFFGSIKRGNHTYVPNDSEFGSHLSAM